MIQQNLLKFYTSSGLSLLGFESSESCKVKEFFWFYHFADIYLSWIYYYIWSTNDYSWSKCTRQFWSS